jgi:hypothetical protein
MQERLQLNMMDPTKVACHARPDTIHPTSYVSRSLFSTKFSIPYSYTRFKIRLSLFGSKTFSVKRFQHFRTFGAL